MPKEKKPLKIAVIGCGINGISCAISLAERGHTIHIYEKKTAFSETSAKSSKLLHGGLRYLENGHFKLVKESLKERSNWVKKLPNMTKIQRFYLPVYEGRSRNKFVLYAGVKLYEILAGRYSLGKSKMHSKRETLEANPYLKPEGLTGSVSYVDVQMDDYRIAEWLKNQALNKGVILKENHEVLSFSNNGSLKTNSSSSENYDFIINAAGPWTKELLNKNNINSKFDMSLVRGSHLIVNLKIQCPLVLQSEKDGRIIFMLPLKNLCLIGTTECKHLIKDPIVCTQIERDYLLNIINSYVDVHLTSKDIVDKYAGVRPLVFNSNTKDISKISRDSAIELNQSLINIFGGKWTSGLSLGHKVSNMIETNSG